MRVLLLPKAKPEEAKADCDPNLPVPRTEAPAVAAGRKSGKRHKAARRSKEQRLAWADLADSDAESAAEETTLQKDALLQGELSLRWSSWR